MLLGIQLKTIRAQKIAYTVGGGALAFLIVASTFITQTA
jgi:hypothetical protein